MKLHLLAMTALVLAGLPLAQAQEESTPEPTAPEQSASPAEDTTVSVTTQKSSPAAKKSSPTPEPAKSPSPSAKSSPAAAASKPAASTKPAAPMKKSSLEAMLRDLENKWAGSAAAHDASVAQALIADDFVGVSSTGKIINKAGILGERKKDTDTYKSAKNGKMDIRIYGDQLAVVVGTTTEIGKDKAGKDFNRSFRWTDTWLERNGTWQCIASEAMAVPK